MTKLVVVCDRCGSDDVRRDAWAAWDNIKQEWVVSEVFDFGYCMACECEAQLVEKVRAGEDLWCKLFQVDRTFEP